MSAAVDAFVSEGEELIGRIAGSDLSDEDYIEALEEIQELCRSSIAAKQEEMGR